MAPILTADSITRIGDEARGAVVVNASHGGIYAAYLAAKLGVAAAIFNDAGVGRDNAGIGDEQNLFCSEFARQFTNLFHAADTEDQTRAWFVIERAQSLRAWRSWRMTHSQISDEFISFRVQ